MAVIPKQAILEWATVKPTTFALYCLLCQVKDRREQDAYLDLAKAEKASIKKSAFYFGFSELLEKGWITFSRQINGQKRWNLIKGFAVENYSANVELNSANVEIEAEQDSAFVENYSANVELNSANVESPPTPPIRNINRPKEQTKETDRKGETRPPAQTPDFEVQIVNGKRGISADQIIPQKLSDADFRQVCETGMKLRLKTPTRLPKQEEWFRVFNFWQTNDYDADELLETFDLLDEIRQKKGAAWLVTPALVEKNIGKLESLNVELENLENGAKNNGSLQNNQPQPSYRDQREQSAIAEYQAIDSVRERVNARRADELRGGDATGG